MPRVILPGSVRQFTGGQSEVEVEADTVRRLLLELERRFPGLGRQVEDSMAISVDGEILQDAYAARLRPDSEIFLIPRLAGGSPS